MAFTVTSAGNFLYLNAGNSPTLDPFTALWWAYPLSLNDNTGVGPGTASSGGLLVYMYTGELYVKGGSLAFACSTTLASNTWYHIALTRSGNSTELFLNGVSDGSGSGTLTGTFLSWGYPYTRPLNARIEAAKHFGAVLTAAEIQQEIYFNMPVRTADLERWSHFVTPDNANFRDYSGTGAANWTEYGSVTQGDSGPPIQWRKGASRVFLQAPAVGGATPKGPLGMPLHGALGGPI